MKLFIKNKPFAIKGLNRHKNAPWVERMDSEHSFKLGSIRYRNLMYVTTTDKCMNACEFCRNDNMDFDKKTTKGDNDAFAENINKASNYMYEVTFGGGEPLLSLDKIERALHINGQTSFKAKASIATSGPRDLFFNKIVPSSAKYRFETRNTYGFNNIYLSRLKADDLENQKAFGGKVELLTMHDILRYYQEKEWWQPDLTILTTCYKNGGIDNADEMIDLVERMKQRRTNNMIFNNLQKDVSNPDYFKKNNVPDEEFERAKAKLRKLGFEDKRDIVFSGGYSIQTLSKDNANVGFKRYHKSDKETKELWGKSRLRSYDFSASPNGDLFVGLKNEYQMKQFEKL